VSLYRFIRAEKASYPIALPCRVRGVARPGDYAWARRGAAARATADAVPTAARWPASRRLLRKHRWSRLYLSTNTALPRIPCSV